MQTRADCLYLLDDVEAMLAGGWQLAAAGFASVIFRYVVAVLLADHGPLPGLAAWLEDEARPLLSVAEAAQELRAALQVADLVPAVVAAHALARRLSLEADARMDRTITRNLPAIRD